MAWLAHIGAAILLFFGSIFGRNLPHQATPLQHLSSTTNSTANSLSTSTSFAANPISMGGEANDVLSSVPATSIMPPFSATSTLYLSATSSICAHIWGHSGNLNLPFVAKQVFNDGTNVYAPWEGECVELQGVDAKTFSILSPEFMKDSKHVYYYRGDDGFMSDDYENLSGLDPATFHFVGTTTSSFVADKDNLYLLNTYGVDLVSGADPSTFSKFISDNNANYYVDKNHIYIVYRPLSCKDGGSNSEMKFLPDADRATFRVVDAKDGYSKDAMHVYYWGDLIPGADPKTFQVLNFTNAQGYFDGFSRDAKHYYFQNKPLAMSLDELTIDSSGSPGGAFATSTNGVAYVQWSGGCGGTAIESFDQLPSINPKTFAILSDGYSKDATHVYYNGELVKGADQNSFVVLGISVSGDFGKDKTHIYNEGQIVPMSLSGQELGSLVFLNSHFAKDNDAIYFTDASSDSSTGNITLGGWEMMPKADPQTFHVLASTAGDNSGYAEDKNNIYYGPYVLYGADSATFQVLNDVYAKDSTHVYNQGRILQGVDPATYQP